ncbi:unnamed protein product, partial [marine sediment metagenome]
SSGTTYVSNDIDISAYTDPSNGRVLVVDKAMISFSRATGGPIRATDIDAVIGERSMGAQALSETQTALVDLNNNAMFLKSNLYASNTVNDAGGAGVYGVMEQTDALNPAEFVSGFIIPTDKIHCGIDAGVAWTTELDVGFLFEVHTEKLSLRRIQELLVSLTAN